MNKTQRRRLEKELHRLRSGEDGARKALYDLLAAPVYYSILRMLRNEHEAQKLTREVFTALLLDLDGTCSPEALLRDAARLLYRHSLQQLRESGRLYPSGEEDALAQFPLTSDYADDPEKTALVHRALDHLGDEARAVLLLHYYNGFCVKDIADILDCDEAAILLRLHRANGALMRLVFGEGGST